MSEAGNVGMLLTILTQWIAVAGTIWLTWWAAQSRDALAFRIVAMVLVVVPSVLWPLLSFAVVTNAEMSIANRAAVFGIIGVVIALARGVFLIIWAIVSRDKVVLRSVGGAVAALLLLQVAGYALAALGVRSLS